jgi:hypothetical protein
MEFSGRRGVTAVILTLVVWLCFPYSGWGQATDRIGTVLVVEGTAEVQAQGATERERLRFRDAIFLNDTVRTAAASKVKVLLRDDSIMTLAENSEMEFTEFLLTGQQRRTIVNLVFGQIRVLTTRIFGTGSATEVYTPNAVAGVRGSDGDVAYVPVSNTTTVFNREGEWELWKRDDPTRRVRILEGQLSQLIQTNDPLPPRPPTSAEARTFRQATATAPSQVPREVETTEQLDKRPPSVPRGEEALPPLPPVLPPLASPPPQVQESGLRDQLEFRELQEENFDQGTETVTSDSGNPVNQMAAEMINQSTLLEIIIPVPR